MLYEIIYPPPPSSFAISVIIPMYNAQEYIGECLDSLLAQTFQNFEVIVVDDCSNDNSVAIIKGYMSKFNGRLKLAKTETNSGGCAVPRNVGLPFARGEYIYFMDSDDTLIQTGFEEIYALAKEYDADVVYCERYYMSEGVGDEFIKNARIATTKCQQPPYVDKPTLEPQDLPARIKEIINNRLWATAWLKFVRRDLLTKYEISFPYVKPGEDDVWTYGLLFFAKNFLRVPNIIYIRRMNPYSITGTTKTAQQQVAFSLNPLLLGVKELDKLMERVNFFKENPAQRYELLENYLYARLYWGFKKTAKLNPIDVYDTIKNTFGERFGDYDVLIPGLCAQIFNQVKLLDENQKELARLNKKLMPEPLQISLAESISSTSLPTISVIIPMYNAAEFIGECLDSLLLQTFKDFEVIAVDDCSTDNSVAIVEEYAPKFDGRLRLINLSKNSATGGYVPRNIGFKFAKGEYVYFVDADDFLLTTALETLYNVVNEYGADVVYMATHYDLAGPDDVFFVADDRNKNLKYQGVSDNPTLSIDEPDANLHLLLFEKGYTTPWVHFVKRDFLLRNNITFPEIPKAGDYIWVINLYCHARRFLRISTPLYFYRSYGTKSISKSNAPDQFFNWVSSFVIFAKTLTNLANRTDILKRNPIYCYQALEKYFKWCLNRTDKARKSLSGQDIYKVLYNEFIKDDDLLEMTAPYFFSVIDNDQKALNNYRIPQSFAPFVTARIDIILKSIVGDFQLSSFSDKVASAKKPGWFQKGGIGYVVNSFAGSLTFVAKASVDGQINLGLKSLDIRDTKDKSKRVPYWIDYTKLIVNDKTIFDKLTPAWHDKPYVYNFNAKANERITIKIDWLPHIGNFIEQKVLPPPPPPKVEKVIPDKFKKYLTARIDAKFKPKDKGDFQILSTSDETAKVSKPKWFQNNGIGYVIQSSEGELMFIAKATADGRIIFNLRGIEVRSREDWRNGVAKRIPYWIDYTRFTLNGKTIFNTLIPAWCDEPYNYVMEVKAGEKVEVNVEWLPHRSDT